jgi:hypothetical protein
VLRKPDRCRRDSGHARRLDGGCHKDAASEGEARDASTTPSRSVLAVRPVFQHGVSRESGAGIVPSARAADGRVGSSGVTGG